MRAFSLVELSIVLVILGLLTGGILTGQSLIRASELRSVATEHARFTAAVQTFRDKYFAMPGDMNNATRFWGRLNANADCVTNSSAAVAAPGACDGNGDGSIGIAAAALASEQFQFFRHLALAGLIEGTYSGIAGAANGNHAIINVNVPPSKLSNAGWAVFGSGVFSDTEMYLADYGNVLEFGAPVTNSRMFGRALRPEEAWNIDTKMDDGRPATGRVIARYWNNACAAADDGTHAANDLNASYRLTDSSLQCSLYFPRAF